MSTVFESEDHDRQERWADRSEDQRLWHRSLSHWFSKPGEWLSIIILSFIDRLRVKQLRLKLNKSMFRLGCLDKLNLWSTPLSNFIASSPVSFNHILNLPHSPHQKATLLTPPGASAFLYFQKINKIINWCPAIGLEANPIDFRRFEGSLKSTVFHCLATWAPRASVTIVMAS